MTFPTDTEVAEAVRRRLGPDAVDEADAVRARASGIEHELSGLEQELTELNKVLDGLTEMLHPLLLPVEATPAIAETAAAEPSRGDRPTASTVADRLATATRYAARLRRELVLLGARVDV